MRQQAKAACIDRPAQAKALVRTLKTAHGAARQRIEEEILALGGDAVDALAQALRREASPDKIVLCALWYLIAMSLVFLGMARGASGLSLQGYVALGLGLLFFLPMGTAERPLRLLLQIDDPRAIAPLVAVSPTGLGKHGPAVQQRLTYLLPRLRREDADLLPVETRIRLRDRIDTIRTTIAEPDPATVDFLIAVMKGLVQIGDQDMRLHLVWAQKDRNEQIRAIAEKGLAELNRQTGEAKRP